MPKHRLLSIVAVSALTLMGLLLFVFDAAGADGLNGQETSLDPDGTPYEIAPDTHGNLWISDYGASQIRQLNPATGVYTAYLGLSNASDARMDAEGAVWWANSGTPATLGRLSPSSSTITTWALQDAEALWGITFDNAGRVWIVDTTYQDGKLYRFTPGTNESCVYPIPDQGISDYLLSEQGLIWLADNANGRVLRLDPAAEEFTLWQLDPNAYPQGLALGGDGSLWWADEGQAALGRLDPQTNALAVYSLPYAGRPEMIALDRGEVWYTESISGTVGILRPSQALATLSTATATSRGATKACQDLGTGVTGAVSTQTGTLLWAPSVYPTVATGPGWPAYQLPASAYPWGIARSEGYMWAVDQARSVLLRLPLPDRTYLPMIRR